MENSTKERDVALISGKARNVHGFHIYDSEAQDCMRFKQYLSDH